MPSTPVQPYRQYTARFDFSDYLARIESPEDMMYRYIEEMQREIDRQLLTESQWEDIEPTLQSETTKIECSGAYELQEGWKLVNGSLFRI